MLLIKFTAAARTVFGYTNIVKKFKEFHLSKQSAPVQQCQVIIVGGGITGLSTAYHLKNAGIEQVVVLTDPARPSSSEAAAGFLLGSLFDNITRVAHAYGLPAAAEVYRFSQQALNSLVNFCTQQQLPVKLAKHLRLIVSSNEQLESSKAIALFKQAHIAASSLASDAADTAKILLRAPPTAKAAPPCNPSAVLAIQDDGLGGGYLDPQRLCKRLVELTRATVVAAAAEQLSWNPDTGCSVRCHDRVLRSELLVLACHHHIAELMPELREIVIPYSDQWGSYRSAGNQLASGLVFTANHGHEWAVVVSENRIHLGGARFLRRLAGTGDAMPRADTKIAAYLQQRFLKFLPAIADLHCEHTVPLIGVRPCDELPIIGPMYGNDRLLIATGFMGNGLSWGFQAGKCLAELIASGRSATLPRRLWPERLRALPE